MVIRDSIYENDDLANEKANKIGHGPTYIDEEWEIIGKGYDIPMTDELAKELEIEISKGFKFGGGEPPELKPEKKTKGWMIRQWYDGTEKILKKGHLDTIEEMMMDTDVEKYGSWDEISMNDFEVVLIGVSDVDVARDAEQNANSAGIPIDAMYSETAENPEDFSYEALKIEMKAQQYFAALQGGSVIVEKNVKKLIKEAVPPSERITLPDLSEKVEYVDSNLDNPDALLISLGGKIEIPTWLESVNLERYFSELELERTQAPPIYYANWFGENEFVNPFQYKLLGIDKGVATGIWKPSQETKKAFGIWMSTVEENPQKYNVEKNSYGRSTVSYTHLTLPTSDLV